MNISRSTILLLAMSAYAALLIPRDRWRWSEVSRAKAASALASSFVQAGAANDVKALKMLLDEGADVNAQDSLGITALIAASSQQKHEAVTFLLAHGSDRNLKTKEGLSALDFAKANHDEAMTNALEAASR